MKLNWTTKNQILPGTGWRCVVIDDESGEVVVLPIVAIVPQYCNQEEEITAFDFYTQSDGTAFPVGTGLDDYEVGVYGPGQDYTEEDVTRTRTRLKELGDRASHTGERPAK